MGGGGVTHGLTASQWVEKSLDDDGGGEGDYPLPPYQSTLHLL